MSKFTRLRKRVADRLKNKYRLVIMDDGTYEEKVSIILSRVNVYVVLSTIFIFLVLVTSSIIVFTPLKEYIPGYGDLDVRRNIYYLRSKTDSLSKIIDNRDLYIANIKNIIQGKIDTNYVENEEETRKDISISYDTLDLRSASKQDSILRDEIEQEDNYRLLDVKTDRNKFLVDLHFFKPLRGIITSSFNPEENHYGIDIVAPENEPVKSTLDGYVIMATWTLETGYVIGIQHSNNLVSFYKHNSVLLKKMGEYVKAGDAIAIVGNSGEQSTGPHLHFELWKEGVAFNPEEYIVY